MEVLREHEYISELNSQHAVCGEPEDFQSIPDNSFTQIKLPIKAHLVFTIVLFH